MCNLLLCCRACLFDSAKGNRGEVGAKSYNMVFFLRFVLLPFGASLHSQTCLQDVLCHVLVWEGSI